MMMPLRKNCLLIKIINNALIDLPPPSNISTLWNFGSLFGIWSMIKFSQGFFLLYIIVLMLTMLLMEYHTSAVMLITVDQLEPSTLMEPQYSCSAGLLLFFILMISNMDHGSFNYINNYSNCFFSMYSNLSTNINLSS